MNDHDSGQSALNTSGVSFASDNYAGAHPEVLEALIRANSGHQSSYGADVYTEQLQDLVKDLFGPTAEAYPVLTGTGANVIALQAMQPRWGAVICAASAHINTDENGAPERVGGMKLLPIHSADGKLTAELIDQEAWGWGQDHRAQPSVVAITQSTELGTVYSLDELRTVTDHTHRHGMSVYADGARISNAAAHLGVSFREMMTDTGVDVLSLGGTKNGLLFGEIIVVLNPKAVSGIEYLRKIAMQTLSKSRFISAQFLELYGTSLGLESAKHANAMTARLCNGIRAGISSGIFSDLNIVQRPQANTIFATLPKSVADAVRKDFPFYDWDDHGQVRWMTSFDTTEADVDAFLQALTAAFVSHQKYLAHQNEEPSSQQSQG